MATFGKGILMFRAIAKAQSSRSPLVLQASVRWLVPKNGFATSSARQAMVTISKDDQTGVATLTLDKKPVNALSLELMTEMNIAYDKLEADNSVRGMILTSAIPNFFSGGLDITEMYQPKRERLREFWRVFQGIWVKLYGSRLITMAALTGHCPAAGCMFAMCSDFSVMAKGKYVTGLNETRLGIVAPFWLVDSLVNTVGTHAADRALQFGELYNADQAFKIGMVDGAAEMDQVLPMVQAEMAEWLKIPDAARQISKMAIRKETLQKFMSKRDQELEEVTEFLMKDSIQKNIGKYLENLKKKKT
ncbi:enoyl-CoA delta isomerase 1, mitochondrial-like [Lineus longissimus]|uniref:enoyl-CoA delta isomerase 1, mitochondrial-like n=1 Tax=Lineus longissimus TaxID=88925 RepID=UPI002B4DCCFE